MLSTTNRVDLLSIEEDLFFLSGAGAAGFVSYLFSLFEEEEEDSFSRVSMLLVFYI